MKFRNLLLAAMLIVLPSAAWAIDFNRAITNLDGTPILDDKGQPINLTLRTICLNALESPFKPEDQSKPDSGVLKTKRHELAIHVLNAPKDNYTFTSEDVSLIKKLVNDTYSSPLVVAQAWEELEKK